MFTQRSRRSHTRKLALITQPLCHGKVRSEYPRQNADETPFQGHTQGSCAATGKLAQTLCAQGVGLSLSVNKREANRTSQTSSIPTHTSLRHSPTHHCTPVLGFNCDVACSLEQLLFWYDSLCATSKEWIQLPTLTVHLVSTLVLILLQSELQGGAQGRGLVLKLPEMAHAGFGAPCLIF